MPPRQTLCVSMLVIFLSFTVLNYRIHIDGYALMELFIHLAGAKKHCCQVFFLATRQLQSVVSSHQAHQAQAATIQQIDLMENLQENLFFSCV